MHDLLGYALFCAVLAVFLAGLRVGRTPEYLDRRIEGREVTLAILAFLSMPLGIPVGGAISATVPMALTSVQDAGPHGLSEILYAYASGTGNNGSAFAGWGAGEPWQTTGIGLAMILGRYAIIVPMLAIAGSLAMKQQAPATAGIFPTHGPLFVTLLVLTFFPALALGPIAEQTALIAGQSF